MMKPFLQRLSQNVYQTLTTGFLLSVLLLAGCLPLQPITNSPTPNATIPSQQSDAAVILTWEGAPLGEGPACVHLTVDANGNAAFGACDQIDQSAPIGENHLNELDAMQHRFASFSAETELGTVRFTGTGTGKGEAWQRALGAWAQLVYSELANGAASATGATVMSWFPGAVAEQPELCTHLTVLVYGYVYVETVPCAGGERLSLSGRWLNDAQMAQLDQWLTTLAPLYVADNYLAGQGTAVVDEPEQRAIDDWAHLVTSEVTSERASATGATAMSWFIDNSTDGGTLCPHLSVLSFGYAYAEIVPCQGGSTVQAIGGSLTHEELTQFDRWLYSNEALYVDNNYLAGRGSNPLPADEHATVAAWATALYERLAMSDTTVDLSELTSWHAYEADSGFVIYYPPTLYTVALLSDHADSPFSGTIRLTPTEMLMNREPRATSYRLSMLAHVADKAYSFSDAATFLANGQALSYAPSLLVGRTITKTNLAGALALRVDDLPVGAAGTTIQLLAIRADIVYELIVEPVQPGNSSDAAAAEANLALIEQIIDTFRFTR